MRALAAAGAGLLILSGSLAAAPGLPACPGCSIVLVSFDALQASRVGAMRGDRPLTPALDRLAASGVAFRQAISPAPWTVPASMSWFTGVSPSRHRVVNKYVDGLERARELANLARLSPGTRTLAEILKRAGYVTGGFTGDAGVSAEFGFDAGFDVYSDSVPAFSGFERSAPAALAWARAAKGRRMFLFLHGYGAHGQHRPPGGLDRRFVASGYGGAFDGRPAQQRELRERGLDAGRLELAPADVEFWRAVYDEKVARSDELFSGFVSSMQAIGFSTATTLWVLISDHGSELFEHGRVDHGATLYDELIRVPFVVAGPGISSGVVVEQQVGTLSLMPTLLELVGVRADEATRGRVEGPSLVPLLRGGTMPPQDVIVETDYRLYTHKRGLRTADGWKLIRTLETGANELYDLRSDPEERADLARRLPRKAYELEQRLFARFKRIGSDLDDSVWELGCAPVYADQCR